MSAVKPGGHATSVITPVSFAGEPSEETIVFPLGGHGSRHELVGRRRPKGKGWEYRCRLKAAFRVLGGGDQGEHWFARDIEDPEWAANWFDALVDSCDVDGVDVDVVVAMCEDWEPRQAGWEWSQEILSAALRRVARSAQHTNSGPHLPRARAGWAVPLDSPLAALIVRALEHAEFAARWLDPSDHSFRALAAFAFAHGPDGEWPRADFERLIEELCNRKRIEILRIWVGGQAAGRVLRWLPRVEWATLRWGDWSQLGVIAGAEEATSPLGYVCEITPTLIRQYRRIPEAFRLPTFLEVVGRYNVPVRGWGRLQELLDSADAPGRAALIRDARWVRSIEELCEFLFEGWQPFDLPEALEQSALLEPLATPRALKGEAARMRNCLARQSSAVRDGRCVYFRPRDGSLINAALVRGGAEWAPGQILGPRNQPVPTNVAAPIRAELRRLAKLMRSVKPGGEDFLPG